MENSRIKLSFNSVMPPKRFREVKIKFRAGIHTGFHRFTEIGQIFHNRYIFSKNFKPSKLKSGKWFGESVNILSEWLRNPGKGTLGG